LIHLGTEADFIESRQYYQQEIQGDIPWVKR
jgi:hypothetical protein